MRYAMIKEFKQFCSSSDDWRNTCNALEDGLKDVQAYDYRMVHESVMPVLVEGEAVITIGEYTIYRTN